MNSRCAILLPLVALGLLSACMAWPPDHVREAVPRYASAESHLLFIDRLAGADEVELDEIGTFIAGGLDDAASADRRLRHALWLAQAGHDGHDVAAARAELEDLADGTSGLRPGPRALAAAELRRLESRVRLERDLAELRRQIRDLTAIESQLDGDHAEDAGQ